MLSAEHVCIDLSIIGEEPLEPENRNCKIHAAARRVPGADRGGPRHLLYCNVHKSRKGT